MNFGGSMSNYKWELVGINSETNERIALPCSFNSIGTIVNQIAKEDAEGLWEIPEGVKKNLKKILAEGILTLEVVSKISKIDIEQLSSYLNDRTHDGKFQPDSVFMLMELTENLKSK